jgi:hypothetical protein
MAAPGPRQHFKAPDLKRLLATLKRAGLRPGRIEIERGKISVIPASDGDAPAAANEWDAATEA